MLWLTQLSATLTSHFRVCSLVHPALLAWVLRTEPECWVPQGPATLVLWGVCAHHISLTRQCKTLAPLHGGAFYAQGLPGISGPVGLERNPNLPKPKFYVNYSAPTVALRSWSPSLGTARETASSTASSSEGLGGWDYVFSLGWTEELGYCRKRSAYLGHWLHLGTKLIPASGW